MRSMVEREALPATVWPPTGNDVRTSNAPVGGRVSLSTTLRAVPLSQEGEDVR